MKRFRIWLARIFGQPVKVEWFGSFRQAVDYAKEHPGTVIAPKVGEVYRQIEPWTAAGTLTDCDFRCFLYPKCGCRSGDISDCRDMDHYRLSAAAPDRSSEGK